MWVTGSLFRAHTLVTPSADGLADLWDSFLVVGRNAYLSFYSKFSWRS